MEVADGKEPPAGDERRRRGGQAAGAGPERTLFAGTGKKSSPGLWGGGGMGPWQTIGLQVGNFR